MSQSCKFCGCDSGCDCKDRINCKQVGEAGHWMCGWCDKHNCPQFQCGCSLKEKYGDDVEIRRIGEIENETND